MTDILHIMSAFTKFLSSMVAVLLVSVGFSSVDSAVAVEPLSDVEYVQPSDDVVVAQDVSLGTVGLDEYVVVSAPSVLKGELESSESFKEFAEHGDRVVSLMTKEDALKVASLDSEVVVETDQIVSTQNVQDNAPWGLDRIDSPSLPLSSTYVYNESGENVTVYVVDSGINTSHVDFAGRIGVGYSALDTDSSVEDCSGHGTHVAGTIAGSVHGVAKNATIVPLRVFGCSQSGSSLDILEALQWILDNHESGPAVINMSLGSTKVQFMNDAVATMVDSGFTVVAAAGNAGANACNYSPASEPKAITVGASNSSDVFQTWSNFGSCVDVVGPGTTIKSAYIGSSTQLANMSGTSMAAPHVAGAAARILGEFPEYTPAQVAAEIDSYTALDKLSGTLNSTPNKLLNLPEDINPTVVLDAPTAPSVSLTRVATLNSKGKVTISGVHAESAAPLTQYTVTALLNNTVYKTETFSNPDMTAPLSLYIDNLPAFNTYSIKVTATNEAGESLPSNTITAKVLYSKPYNVSNLTRTLTGDKSYILNWTAVADVAPNNGGLPLSGYKVFYSSNGRFWNLLDTVSPTTTTTATTPVLKANTIYYVKVVTYSDSWKNASVGRTISFRTAQ